MSSTLSSEKGLDDNATDGIEYLGMALIPRESLSAQDQELNIDQEEVVLEMIVKDGNQGRVEDEASGVSSRVSSSSEEKSVKKRKIKKELDPEEFKALSLLKLGAVIDKIWSMTTHKCRVTEGDLKVETDAKDQIIFKARWLKCGVWIIAQRSEYCFKVGNYKKHVSVFHVAPTNNTSNASEKGNVQLSAFGFLDEQSAKKAKLVKDVVEIIEVEVLSTGNNGGEKSPGGGIGAGGSKKDIPEIQGEPKI